MEKLFISDFTLFPKQSTNFKEDIFYAQSENNSVFDTLYVSRQLYGCSDCGRVNITTSKLNEPFFKGIEIGLKKPSKLQSPTDKLVLCYQNEKGTSSYIASSYKEGWITGKIMRPGIYYVTTDMIPPFIRPTNISKKNIVKGGFINFEIKDKLSGIATYRGTLNGKWVLMDYDAKNDWLTYIFDENTPKGKHIFKLEVVDKKGNRTVWNKTVIIN
ncbi:MAG: hypothetical protein HYZ42_18370 [Bacteroidetes bacterium]|nr:hypothetical protein [Bacteroidota bacterium]